MKFYTFGKEDAPGDFTAPRHLLSLDAELRRGHPTA